MAKQFEQRKLVSFTMKSLLYTQVEILGMKLAVPYVILLTTACLTTALGLVLGRHSINIC